ncbi:hypothetical protein SERLADRAFT_432426 [Serpula lacrymans var. lacrymans S7.9]|uniref:Uncharacterized protein n=1 Tax=Serpula lacrymans var. lacrymans (strain S7.9) TaxID=578457 RepID=F8NF78_SERL9|nr:uncharacterized protein SERLADRAFT_432426 [Serpula lacrymans var. lacrymans S7.9]EGO30792.1 hypothetical protein SERLADRAFT_432426 [Serpula lacrymans var. lacrymans S7.9]
MDPASRGLNCAQSLPPLTSLGSINSMLLITKVLTNVHLPHLFSTSTIIPLTKNSTHSNLLPSFLPFPPVYLTTQSFLCTGMAQSSHPIFIHLDNVPFVYAPLNSETIPYVPPKNNILCATMHPQETLFTRQASKIYSYIGFTPLKIHFEGMLLGCLALHSKVPVEYVNGKYYLTANLQEFWLMLEDEQAKAAKADKERTEQEHLEREQLKIEAVYTVYHEQLLCEDKHKLYEPL